MVYTSCLILAKLSGHMSALTLQVIPRPKPTVADLSGTLGFSPASPAVLYHRALRAVILGPRPGFSAPVSLRSLFPTLSLHVLAFTPFSVPVTLTPVSGASSSSRASHPWMQPQGPC